MINWINWRWSTKIDYMDCRAKYFGKSRKKSEARLGDHGQTPRWEISNLDTHGREQSPARILWRQGGFKRQCKGPSPNERSLIRGRNCLKSEHLFISDIFSDEDRQGETITATTNHLKKSECMRGLSHKNEKRTLVSNACDGHNSVHTNRSMTKSMTSQSQPSNAGEQIILHNSSAHEHRAINQNAMHAWPILQTTTLSAGQLQDL